MNNAFGSNIRPLTFAECDMDGVTADACALGEGSCEVGNCGIGWGRVLGGGGVGASGEQLCGYFLAS